VTVPEDVSTANVGPPLSSTRIRLVDVPEMGYLWSDLNEQGQHAPRGEIWIGGTPVAVGYFEMPEKTAEDFCDEMGLHWFKTGDIGRLNPDGTLSIVDRKKDLIKLSGGEYVALGAIEAVLKALPFVDNICVYGDSLQQNPVAVLVPNRAKLLALATNEVGLSEAEAQWPAVCQHEKVKSHVLKQVALFAKAEGLKPFEIISNALITTDEWFVSLFDFICHNVH
jgi:long-chain acyl-CoA synthetase